tara:strand:- start:76 stop:483 length:408 start_codon:yes stop_codon:yes gene_type:complete
MGYSPRWEAGSWIALCDACGKKFKANDLQKRWDGLMVCLEDFEQRQPQDFVRGSTDKIAVPWSRSEPEDTYEAICTIEGITAFCGLAMAGCSLAGNNTVPPSPYSFCLPAGVYSQADYGSSDCAQADKFDPGYLP